MKRKNLIDVKAFYEFKDSWKRFPKSLMFADGAYAGNVLKENLTHIDPTIFEKKFPELTFMACNIEANNVGGFAQRIQSLRTVNLGSFANAGDKSGNKGKISLFSEDNTILVVERSAESEWSDTDVEQARMEGRNLPAEYLSGHNEVYMREIDEIGLVGRNTNAGTLVHAGLLNYAGYPTSNASGLIDTLTPQQMYDVISDLILDQHNAVNNTTEYMATKVVMAVRVMNELRRTILDTTSSTKTVLRALMDNYPDIMFMSTFRAEDVYGDAGTANASSTVAFSTDMQSMVMRIPVPLRVGAIRNIDDFTFQVKSKYRIAGLDVLENTGGRQLRGL